MSDLKDQLLTLRPATGTDTQQIRAILDQPGLARRHLFEGISEVHPVEWSLDHRTFGVRLGEALLGAVELRRDEDERDQWELSIVLAEHKRSYDGARSALAGVAYAFQKLQARAVWFWVPSNNQAIRAFADQVGFVELHTLRLPNGATATVFEIDQAAWKLAAESRLGMFFEYPVQIQTTGGVWHGSQRGFTYESLAE